MKRVQLNGEKDMMMIDGKDTKREMDVDVVSELSGMDDGREKVYSKKYAHLDTVSANVPLCAPLSKQEQGMWGKTRKYFLEQYVTKNNMTGKEILEKIESLPFDWITRMVRGVAWITDEAAAIKECAANMSNSIQWRIDNNVDSTLDRNYPNLRLFRTKVWPMRFYGKTPEGNAILMVRLKDCDWEAAQKVLKKNALFEYVIFHQELLFERLRIMQASSRSVIIFDFGGMTMRDYRAAFSYGLAGVFNIWGKHYPESVQSLYLINTPMVFSMVFKLVKKWIEPDTLLKLHLHGSVSSTFINAIKEQGLPYQHIQENLAGKGPEYGFVIPDGVIEHMESGCASMDVESLHNKDVVSFVAATTEVEGCVDQFDFEEKCQDATYDPDEDDRFEALVLEAKRRRRALLKNPSSPLSRSLSSSPRIRNSPRMCSKFESAPVSSRPRARLQRKMVSSSPRGMKPRNKNMEISNHASSRDSLVARRHGNLLFSESTIELIAWEDPMMTFWFIVTFLMIQILLSSLNILILGKMSVAVAMWVFSSLLKDSLFGHIFLSTETRNLIERLSQAWLGIIGDLLYAGKMLTEHLHSGVQGDTSISLTLIAGLVALGFGEAFIGTYHLIQIVTLTTLFVPSICIKLAI